jgi:hypothetical protein
MHRFGARERERERRMAEGTKYALRVAIGHANSALWAPIGPPPQTDSAHRAWVEMATNFAIESNFENEKLDLHNDDMDGWIWSKDPKFEKRQTV